MIGRTGPGARRLLPVAALLVALPLALAAHRIRPAAFGDLVTPRPAAAAPAPHLLEGRAVTARRWTYTRTGSSPLAARAFADHAVVLWEDGLVTDSSLRGGRVRWHRAIPGAAGWLARPEGRGGQGVLQPLGRDGRMIAVVTPQRIAGYRAADGDLRWVLPARPGCAFQPSRAVLRGSAAVVAQPCADPRAAWTSELIAVDGLGRVAPDRTPLGNKRLATPR
ncbi:hypothetical protein QMK19_19935 [Streptomyces sp. H10-C2]|uniref:hypothetical protein n=1 Tax=unclassified Streptomyces TaxID=2593676 RepID=UPI0024BBA873|nr:MULTISPECIES: hypothetical protein [unclassified Streptomyces]MDJ0344824.1 hypothetical protein [Streptomyces sp. PH10-H1]MDJ0371884.1 hypothetical protein [Streptomyces sp. H10-C2]